MTATGTVEAVLAQARSYLGVAEQPPGSNLQPFAHLAGHANGLAWCCTFCVATAKLAKIAGVPDTASCQASVDAYSAAGRLFRTPQRGDQGFLYFPLLKRYAHTGWVEEVRPGGVIVMIEGNTDAKGGRTGGKVMRHVRNATHGMIFGRPQYAAAPAPAKKAAPKKTAPRTDPVITVGAKGQTVLNVQNALIRGGFLAKGSADGDFGPGTLKALKACQRAAKLPQTGKTDGPTWRALRALKG